MTTEQKEFIESLETRSGKITPADIIEAARPEDSPIHDCFEWDDTAAAAAWRMEQARDLIRRVKIEIQYEETTIRTVKYVRDTTAKPEESRYANLMKARKTTARDIVMAEWEAVLALAIRAHGITQAKACDIEDGDTLAKSSERVLIEIQGMID
jgi:hypothetical protein